MPDADIKKPVDDSGDAGAAVEKDAEALLAEANERITKLADERDNYKRGLLKAKGKLDEEDLDPSREADIEKMVDAKVKAALLETQYTAAQKERDELLSKIVKENKELRLAIKNKPGGGTSSGGGSSGPKVSDNILSEEQERELRTVRGWDDKKVDAYKKNLRG